MDGGLVSQFRLEQIVMRGDNVLDFRTVFRFLKRKGLDQDVFVGYRGRDALKFSKIPMRFDQLFQYGLRFEVDGRGSRGRLKPFTSCVISNLLFFFFEKAYTPSLKCSKNDKKYTRSKRHAYFQREVEQMH